MNSTTRSLLVGLVAGFASALLVLGSGDVTALSVLLSAFATLPILIAGLGWSNIAGGVSVVAAAAILAVAVSPLASLMIAVTTFVPAAWIAHLSNLARPADELGGPQGQLAWFPLSDIMLHLCGLVCVSLIVLGFAIGYGENVVGEIVDQLFAILTEQNPEFQPSTDYRNDMVAFMTRILPALQATMWVMILFAAWYLASAIVRVSGRAKRPADVIPASLRMSRLSMLVFGVGLLGSFGGGTIGLIGATVSGAFAGGFMLAGLAMLASPHGRSRLAVHGVVDHLCRHHHSVSAAAGGPAARRPVRHSPNKPAVTAGIQFKKPITINVSSERKDHGCNIARTSC